MEESTEIHFYKRHSGRGAIGAGQMAEGGWQGQFFARASNQISLMKWIYGIQPDEPGATASMPSLPETAVLAVSLWLPAIL